METRSSEEVLVQLKRRKRRGAAPIGLRRRTTEETFGILGEGD